MKKAKAKLLVKILILVLGFGLLVFTGQDVYRYFIRAQGVNRKFVQTYQAQLNIELIKKAAGILR